jgi:hypothetical protein
MDDFQPHLPDSNVVPPPGAAASSSGTSVGGATDAVKKPKIVSTSQKPFPKILELSIFVIC